MIKYLIAFRLHGLTNTNNSGIMTQLTLSRDAAKEMLVLLLPYIIIHLDTLLQNQCSL